ncbi:hypothetical protein AB0P21_22115 [Kribbella sp. NPDC056861]|uniref:hypothetical protein n=1 Tax=Kribbella sp. NPDC056861 TaxID=3154857 RepID=UPI003432A347
MNPQQTLGAYPTAAPPTAAPRSPPQPSTPPPATTASLTHQLQRRSGENPKQPARRH